MKNKVIRIEPAKTPNGYYTIDRIVIRPVPYKECYDLEGIPVGQKKSGVHASYIRGGYLLPPSWDIRDIYKDGIGWDDSGVEAAAREYITNTLGYTIIN